jgi:Glycine rich protein
MAIGVVVASVLALTNAAGAGATTQTFNSTGGEQTFTVPAGVTFVHVVAIGGRGGSGDSSGATGGVGGFGAQVAADLPVTAGQLLYIEVAGNGKSGLAPNPGAGGFNGGGAGGFTQGGGGGGGASDVRTRPLAAGLAPDTRLLIAAGGGGGGAGSSSAIPGSDGGAAGNPGALETSGGNAGGGPGTATAGGAGGTPSTCEDGIAGALGLGGAGGGSSGSGCSGGGGGGGGLFGGGGGATGGFFGGAGGGGGSTAFAAGATNTSIHNDSTGVPSITLTYASNKFSFGKVKDNKKNGTATIAVKVPGPGILSLTGNGIKSQRHLRGASASRTVSGAGTVKLTVKAKGPAKTKLNHKGKVKVKAKVTFSPIDGSSNTQTKTVRLVKKLR